AHDVLQRITIERDDQRTREIGIRMALGANGRSILGLVLKQGGRLAAVGLSLGLLIALGASRLLTGFLFGVAPSDVTTMLGAMAILLAVAILATYLPARPASRLDPAEALRRD